MRLQYIIQREHVGLLTKHQIATIAIRKIVLCSYEASLGPSWILEIS